MIRMLSRFTFTRSKYIVKYFFSSVSTFDLSYTHGNRVARQLKIFATVHRIKRRIIVLIPPRIITPLWIRLTRLFPFNDYFSAPIFVTDEIGCEVELSPTYGHVNERLETLRMRTGDHRTDRERTSYPRNHPAPDCVSVSMHFRVFRGHRN